MTEDCAASAGRAASPALDAVLGKEFPALDKGFVRVVDYMGNDAAVVQAARVSYGAGTKKTSEDAALIRYLMRHRHTTPFEMCEIKFHVKMPVFVARQWIRHRTASVNEYSARYSVLEDEFYVPEARHVAGQSAINKQGRGDTAAPEKALRAQEIFREDAAQCYAHYRELLEEGEGGSPGVARELARMNLPVSVYTQWYWKIDLHNLLHFLHLRSDSHAQYEIRVYAEIIEKIIALWTPICFGAYEDYRKGAVSLSRGQWEAVKAALRGEEFSSFARATSKREWNELCDAMERPGDKL
ncbi:MAG: FAD-dependent thymidylate synthase [Rickettsiales bacterium]